MPSGDVRLSFNVDQTDGFGRVDLHLETRPVIADDWHGTITL